jgi:hypothetical protein
MDSNDQTAPPPQPQGDGDPRDIQDDGEVDAENR